MNTRSMQSEHEVISRARAGSHEAFTELVNGCSRQVYGISLRMLKNHEDAEDNTQNVLCRAYTNIKQFQGNSRFSTWMVRIAINEALMRLRKLKAEPVFHDAPLSEDDPAAPEIKDQRCDLERDYITKEIVTKSTSDLKPILRDTLILQEVEGWTNRELAKASGISIDTVKSRVFRARAQARGRLKDLSKECRFAWTFRTAAIPSDRPSA